MGEHREPLDDLIRRVVGDPEPAPGDRARAEARLAVAMREERLKRRPRWSIAVAGAAVVVFIVGLLVVFDVGPGFRVSAAIEEIAEAIEEVSPLSVGDTQFLYTQSEARALGVIPRDALGGVPYEREYLVYLLPRIRETWRGTEGGLQIRETVGEPVFFSERAETVYYLADLEDVDRVGETVTQTFIDGQIEQWPMGSDALDAVIRDVIVTNRGLPEEVEYLDVAVDILRDPLQPPEVRQTVVRLIGELEGLQLVESTAEAVTLSVEYADREVRTRLTFTITSFGYLSFEQRANLTADEEYGIPAGTVTWQAGYAQPIVVDSLDTP